MHRAKRYRLSRSRTAKFKKSDWLERFSNNPLNRLLRTLEPLGVALAVLGLCATIFQLWQDIEDRKQQRIVNAWQLLTTPASGNSGKAEAIRYLFSQGKNLNGIDLSCEKHGGWLDESEWEGEKKRNVLAFRCKRPVLISDFEFTFGSSIKSMSSANLTATRFSSGKMDSIDFSSANLRHAQFNSVTMAGANLRRSDVSGTRFNQVDLTNVDFRSAIFDKTYIIEANISGTRFFQARGLQGSSFWEVWAWDDNPPRGLPEDAFAYRTCPKELRANYTGVIAPKGC